MHGHGEHGQSIGHKLFTLWPQFVLVGLHHVGQARRLLCVGDWDVQAEPVEIQTAGTLEQRVQRQVHAGQLDAPSKALLALVAVIG